MSSSTVLRVLVSCAAAASLGGCYAVPIATPLAQPPSASIDAPPAAPQYITLNARLYPSNDAALRSGMVVAYLVNQRDGRGTFSVFIAGEQFNGEAIRTGSCALSTGARYSMHFGS